MPYINPMRRFEINTELENEGTDFVPANAGDMNYLTSELMNNYFRENGLNYANINEMIGFLECCKMELYRLLAAPYEEEKIEENGNVYFENLEIYNMGKERAY